MNNVDYSGIPGAPMERSIKNYFHSVKGMELTAEPVYFELSLAETGIFSVLAKFECGRSISPDRVIVNFEFSEPLPDPGALRLVTLPQIGLCKYVKTRAGETIFNLEFPPGLKGTIRVGVRAWDADDTIVLKSFAALSTEPFETLSERYPRDIERFQKYSWRSIGEFLSAEALENGLHTIAISDLLLDFFVVSRRPDAPLLCHLHGNAPPRSEEYLLPAITGWKVTEGLDASILAISDPCLLLDQKLELAWHAGTASVPLQFVYELILNKVIKSLSPSRVIFWGGSGGGFASLYLSSRIAGSIAFVWNPQTTILAYEESYVRQYAEVCFGEAGEDVSEVFAGKIVSDISEVYPNEVNRVIWLQNKNDWHTEAHLLPFLKKTGLMEALPESCSRWVNERIYLCLGEFSEGHQPPPKDMIRRMLVSIVAKDISELDLDGVISGKLPDEAPKDRAASGEVSAAATPLRETPAQAAPPEEATDASVKPQEKETPSQEPRLETIQLREATTGIKPEEPVAPLQQSPWEAAAAKGTFAESQSAVPLPASARKEGVTGFLNRLPFRKAGVLFQLSLIPVLLTFLYFGFIASDRYVSEARVVVDRTDFSGGHTMDFASLLTTGGNSHDIMLLRDHLRSVDMLNKLDARLKLRAHYSDGNYDVVSRMWSNEASQELFHSHFLSRVRIEMDTLANVLSIRVQAYTPEMANAISIALVEEGEKFMNEMAHRLAREQVAFLEVQASQMKERVIKTRSAVVEYQNAKGLVSPQGTAEAVSSIVAKLEGELAELKAKRQAMLGYLSPKAPEVSQLNLQIGAYEKQLKEEQARLASPKGSTLNKTIEEFQRLQLEAEFAQDTYKTALMALEKGRVEAIRTLKKVSILQNPTLPQYPVEPRRVYNIIVYTFAIMAITGVIQMFIAIIRDHKD